MCGCVYWITNRAGKQQPDCRKKIRKLLGFPAVPKTKVVGEMAMLRQLSQCLQILPRMFTCCPITADFSQNRAP